LYNFNKMVELKSRSCLNQELSLLRYNNKVAGKQSDGVNVQDVIREKYKRRNKKILPES
jgi:hypothetical protein